MKPAKPYMEGSLPLFSTSPPLPFVSPVLTRLYRFAAASPSCCCCCRLMCLPHTAPAYIAETSPPSVRGMLISLKEAMIVAGILAGYASGFWFVDAVGGWRSMYGVAAPLALLLGVGMVSYKQRLETETHSAVQTQKKHIPIPTHSVLNNATVCFIKYSSV